MAQLVFLIGMPAAGKTYWGEQVAASLGISFIDLDKYIVTNEEADIPAIFEGEGEQVFRQKESQYLTQLVASRSTDVIIASGGGTPCFNNNLELMKASGTVIYLQAAVPHLLSNLAKDNVRRPMLADTPDLAGFLQQLLETRKGFYEEAHIILPSDNISLPTFAEIVASCINKP